MGPTFLPFSYFPVHPISRLLSRGDTGNLPKWIRMAADIVRSL